MPWGAIASGGMSLLRDTLGNSRNRRNVRYGHELDNRYSLEREGELYNRAMERGLTPQEYYGSPAPGAPGVSGGAQTLGNASNQQTMQTTQLMAEAAGKAADRAVMRRGQDTQKEVAEIQAEAQTSAAETAADASRENTKDTVTTNLAIARLNNLIKSRQLDLSEREFNEVTLPAAAANIGLTEQQTKKVIQEVMTSAPDFVRGNILLTMGFDNTLQNMVLKRFDVDPTSTKSMQKLSDDEYEKILTIMLGYSSRIRRELSGTNISIKDAINWLIENSTKRDPDIVRNPPLSGPPGR